MRVAALAATDLLQESVNRVCEGQRGSIAIWQRSTGMLQQRRSAERKQ